MSEHGSGDEGDGDAKAVRWDSPASVFKWLVPSFAVLFLLVGYVVHSAHQSLLGFPTSDSERFEETAFSADAADFLRDLLTTIGQFAFDDVPALKLPLGDHGGLVLACFLAALLASAIGLIPTLRPWPRIVDGIRCVLVIAVFLAKFAVLDAPMTHLENVVVGSADFRAIDNELGPPPSQLLWQKSDGGRGVESNILRRTSTLWKLMVCSRVAGLTFPKNPTYSGAGCPAPPKVEPDKPIQTTEFARPFEEDKFGLYFAEILTSCFIFVIAIGMLLSRRPTSSIIALLALFSLLAVPYAYGKLMKPLYFTYARVILSKDAAHKPAPTYGFLIARNADYTDILEAVDERCSEGNRRELRFTSLPASQIVAVEEIYRRDLITWKVENEASCPAGLPPTGIAHDTSK